MPPDSPHPAVRPDGLQLEVDRGHQEMLWRVERWAWAGFLVITLAAALGATGAGGPLSRRIADTENGRIDYPGIARWEAPDRFVVRFPEGPVERSLTFGPQFDEVFRIDDIQPPPSAETTGPEGSEMRFRLEGGGPARVVVHVTPLRPGLARYRARLTGGEWRELTTFLLP